MQDSDKLTSIAKEYSEAAKKFAEEAKNAQIQTSDNVAEINKFIKAVGNLQSPISDTKKEKKGKTLNSYLDDYFFFTGKVSELNRNLSFAGIAIIWLFRNDPDTKKLNEVAALLPPQLYLPLTCLVVALSLDFLQYILGSIFWGAFYNVRLRQWKNNKLSDEQIKDLEAPNILSGPIDLVFVLKIIPTIVAYVCIFFYLKSKMH